MREMSHFFAAARDSAPSTWFPSRVWGKGQDSPYLVRVTTRLKEGYISDKIGGYRRL